MDRSRSGWAAVALFALLLAAYANHFGNGFHFDDSHAIVDNAFVRDVRHIPRFFTDATTFSVLPLNQSYRPVLQTTLAVDYWIAGGYKPASFQLDTFVWFVLLLAMMYVMCAAIAEKVSPGDRANPWTALVAGAVFAVHPVGAETVNYVIQRGKILSTVGVAAGLVLYAAGERWRLWGVYLVPVALGALAKPPALVFPALLLAHLWLFESTDRDVRRGPKTPRPPNTPNTSHAPNTGTLLRAIAPSIVLVSAIGFWMGRHMPSSYTMGGGPALQYWITQTWVVLRYLVSFFAPLWLSADNDWRLVAGLSDPRAVAGLIAVGALVWAAVWAGRRRETRPVAFGVWWCLIALVPTSVTPLAEVANDHRMFFPFVGLTLAVVWTARLLAQRFALAGRPVALAVAVVAVLAAETVGLHARNDVWRTDESLWHDVTIKSPTNGRGLMNYGLARMEQGDYPTAVAHFERALAFTPNYALLYINLGIAYGAQKRTADAERELAKAIALDPNDWRPHVYYGRWLSSSGHTPAAINELTMATVQNPLDLEAKRLLDSLTTNRAATAEQLLARSLAEYRAGRFRECIAAAQEALTLRPGYAEAYNNIAAGHNALNDWDEGIVAAQQAVALKPDFELARNNLAYAVSRKQGKR